MTYAAGRRVLDADAHIMEPPGWLERFVATDVAERLQPLHLGDDDFEQLIASSETAVATRVADTEAHAAARAELMTMPRKGWTAFGAFDGNERTEALDELGFDLQVVYPTAAYPQLILSPPDTHEAAAIGMNRGLVEFCSGDRRLLATAYVPLHAGVDAAVRVLDDALGRGVRVVMVDMIPVRGAKATSHPDHDVIWSRLVDAGAILSVHVGLDSGWRPVRREFFDNGRTLEHFRSDAPGDALTYTTIGYAAQLFLSGLVLDGVLERFPTLRISVAELGAVWVPSFLETLDQSFRAFRRLQDLRHLTLTPSDYIRRQVRFTPFAGEPLGWMFSCSDASLYTFSSDYPHHEGSDDPIRRFDQAMPNATDAQRHAFYYGNFAELLGPPS